MFYKEIRQHKILIMTYSSSTNTSDDEDNSRHKSSSRRRKERKRNHKHRHRSKSKKSQKRNKEDFSSSSSSYEDRRQSKKVSRHRSNGSSKKRRREDGNGERKRNIAMGAEEEDSASSTSPTLKLARSLLDLFQSHPQMASDLPVMLYRMGSGATFDLSQVQPLTLQLNLSTVFQSLSFACVRKNEQDEWCWGVNEGRAHQRPDELTLVKIVYSSLNSLGFTQEYIDKIEEKKVQSLARSNVNNAPAQNKSSEKTDERNMLDNSKEGVIALHKLIEIFERFHKMGLTPIEMKGMFEMVLAENDAIILDDLENIDLQHALRDLFAKCELKEEETEDSAKGFILPAATNPRARKKAMINLDFLVEACEKLDGASRDPNTLDLDVLKKLSPPSHPIVIVHEKDEYPQDVNESSEESDDDGPQLVNARRTSVNKDLVRDQADKRRQELNQAMGRIAPVNDKNVREEWMLEPNEHDLLASLASKGAALKSRSFRNEKHNGQTKSTDDKEINPEVQAEMRRLLMEHNASRGPSLIDLHRETKRQERDEKKSSGKWGWNREKNLDDGRRIDKNALSMVMGGAADNLKEKFQGTVSKSFM